MLNNLYQYFRQNDNLIWNKWIATIISIIQNIKYNKIDGKNYGILICRIDQKIGNIWYILIFNHRFDLYVSEINKDVKTQNSK